MAGSRPQHPIDRQMASIAAPTRRQLSMVDLGSLLFLGAVWGAAFLFLRIAAPRGRAGVGRRDPTRDRGRGPAPRCRSGDTPDRAWSPDHLPDRRRLVLGRAVHPHRDRRGDAAGRIHLAPERRDAAVHRGHRGRVLRPADLVPGGGRAGGRGGRGGHPRRLVATGAGRHHGPCRRGRPGCALELRRRRQRRSRPAGRCRAARARDRDGHGRCPRRIAGRHPVRAARRARHGRSHLPRRRRRPVDRGRLADLLPRPAPHDPDRGKHGHLHRPGLRHRMGLDRPGRTGRCRPRGGVRADPHQPDARARDQAAGSDAMDDGTADRRLLPEVTA